MQLEKDVLVQFATGEQWLPVCVLPLLVDAPGPEHTINFKPYNKWTVEEVYEWVGRVSGIKQFAQNFVSAEISGAVLKEIKAQENLDEELKTLLKIESPFGTFVRLFSLLFLIYTF